MRRKKKRKLKKQFKIILISIPIIVAVVLLVIYAFQLKTVNVKFDLNQFTEKEVRAYMKKEKIDNTLIFWTKNKVGLSDELCFFEEYTVSMNSPFEVTIKGYEKRLRGYIKKDKLYYYLDDEGDILKISDVKMPDVPKITGIEYDKLQLYQRIETKDEKSLDRLLKVCDAIGEYEFDVKRIDISEKQETVVYIKKIQVQLGNDDNLNKKLQSLNDMYKNVIRENGVLNMKHLNNDGVYTLKKTKETDDKKKKDKNN